MEGAERRSKEVGDKMVVRRASCGLGEGGNLLSEEEAEAGGLLLEMGVGLGVRLASSQEVEEALMKG